MSEFIGNERAYLATGGFILGVPLGMGIESYYLFYESNEARKTPEYFFSKVSRAIIVGLAAKVISTVYELTYYPVNSDFTLGIALGFSVGVIFRRKMSDDNKMAEDAQLMQEELKTIENTRKKRIIF